MPCTKKGMRSTRETNKSLEEEFMMNESFGRAGYGEVSNQERQSADTLIDDDSQPIRIEFPRMQQTAQRE
ncbi:hypothetical protein THER5_1825 [Bifidobacterium thermacidophilum subsp. thermacidophilum]|uniref:Uncharacterized protein n=1 Tax=Bifidobacterium thermacidophilum subsp. thermacidophilum TaxID=79262 RepID=A0A087E8Z7_9BIFI|nr:hypothetical protein THER5_1825 [Bifidobacterium thermacidophilum subsp. thermacidophilum]